MTNIKEHSVRGGAQSEVHKPNIKGKKISNVETNVEYAAITAYMSDLKVS